MWFNKLIVGILWIILSVAIHIGIAYMFANYPDYTYPFVEPQRSIVKIMVVSGLGQGLFVGLSWHLAKLHGRKFYAGLSPNTK